ncbi:MAG: hypothetical protein LBT09_09285 [Planctomycetaceae bacterium]|jgi:hypothetical protein|nr:hypothetical protein [Planctomycetaceae bacterium]
MKNFNLVLLFLFCATSIGCGMNSLRPVDLPALSSCKITITQKGVPLSEATVMVISKSASAKYRTASGVTDNSGVADLRTYGFSGVPAGEFKVVVKKTVLEGAEEITDKSGAKQVSGGQDYNLVNKKYSNEETTDLKIEIKTGENVFSFDVGEPVHELGDSIKM